MGDHPISPRWAVALLLRGDKDWNRLGHQPNGSAPSATNWVYDLGGNGWGNAELEAYTDRRENSRIENGHLVIEARRKRVAATRLPNRQQYPVISFHIAIVEAERLAILYPAHLHPDEIIRIVDDAHLVGLGVSHAHP